MLRTSLAPLVVLVMLAGCSTFTKEPPIKVQSTTKVVCPDIKEYSADTQNRVADEIDKPVVQKEAPATLGLLRDYGSLRAGIRKCHESKSKGTSRT